MKCEVIKRNMYVLMVLVLLLGLILYFGTAPMASAADPEGWVLQYDVGGFYDLSAVDANTAWAVNGAAPFGHGGDPILKTTDGGSNWVTKYSNPSHGICGISAVDADTAWAVGLSGLILKTTNGGANWVVQNSGITTTLRGVSAVDADTAWAVGQYRNILKTTNGGSTWVKQYTSGTSENWLYGVSAADANNAWAVGYDRILNTKDGGASWQLQRNSAGWGVSAVDANTAWASGTSNILKTTDGGATWVTKDLGTPSSITGVSAVDANTAWAVGQDPSGKDIILKTTDGGSTWVVQHPGSPGYLMLGVSAVDATTAWAGGFSGILGTHDGGDERPDIASIAPSSGRIGNEVTISGCDFGSSQGSSSVSFGAVQATGYNSWSDTQIKVLVPSISQGLYQVTVTTPAGTSNGVSFTRKPPSNGCGTGGGMAVAMLGLTLGLLSVAGSLGIRKRLLTRLQQVR